MQVFMELDADACGEICQEEFCEMLEHEECRAMLRAFCPPPTEVDDLAESLLPLFSAHGPLLFDELLDALACIAEGRHVPSKAKIVVTISCATATLDGKMTLQVNMLSGNTFEVTCDEGVCASSVAKQVREHIALDDHVELVTPTGIVLSKTDVLPAALESQQADLVKVLPSNKVFVLPSDSIEPSILTCFDGPPNSIN
jgi:hypothetical protein